MLVLVADMALSVAQASVNVNCVTRPVRLTAMTTLDPFPQTPPAPDRPGPLAGVRVVEVAHEFSAFAGRLLADAGAEVILVEPPGGAEQRNHGPFADNEPGPERSLSFWAENTSKHSVVADLDHADGANFFRQLVASADVLLEAEPPGRLDALGLDYDDLVIDHPDIIHVSITPFGRTGGTDPVTDLTILARGGPMWSCGYDDHELAPVRGRGNQGIRIAAHFAVMSTMTALLARRRHGGQFIDVSMNGQPTSPPSSPAMAGWRPNRPCSARPAATQHRRRRSQPRCSVPTAAF